MAGVVSVRLPEEVTLAPSPGGQAPVNRQMRIRWNRQLLGNRVPTTTRPAADSPGTATNVRLLQAPGGNKTLLPASQLPSGSRVCGLQEDKKQQLPEGCLLERTGAGKWALWLN